MGKAGRESEKAETCSPAGNGRPLLGAGAGTGQGFKRCDVKMSVSGS